MVSPQNLCNMVPTCLLQDELCSTNCMSMKCCLQYMQLGSKRHQHVFWPSSCALHLKLAPPPVVGAPEYAQPPKSWVHELVVPPAV